MSWPNWPWNPRQKSFKLGHYHSIDWYGFLLCSVVSLSLTQSNRQVVPFLRYSTSKNVVTLKSASKVTQGHRHRHGSTRHLWLPINVIATVNLSHTVSEIKGDFSRKSPIFPTTVYFTPPLKGFPLELGKDAGAKIVMMRSDGRKSFSIGLAVQTQYRRVTDGLPDIQQDIFRQQGPR